MNVLTHNENESITGEADELCNISKAYNDRLFENKRGYKASIEGKDFYCISSDKNIIYRVQGNYKWFLKFSLKKKWVQHEIAGAESVKTALSDFKGYQHAKEIRASINERYTLYSAIDGKSFNRTLLEACLLRPSELKNSTLLAMENLGRGLGLLHSYDSPSGLSALNPNNIFYLRNYLNNIKEHSSIVESITDWVNGQDATSKVTGWIHGNIKSEDIFFDRDKVCMIDFGTCGAGVPYEDLTNLCTYMMLFRTVPLFPWRLARQAMSVFLQGYAAEYNYDKNDLMKYMSQGIFRYYLKNIIMHRGVASISRMPILRSHIERLVLQLLEEDYDAAFKGIRI